MAITTREGKTQTTLAEINMIPFIDIVLVLLIIFMVTAPVLQSVDGSRRTVCFDSSFAALNC